MWINYIYANIYQTICVRYCSKDIMWINSFSPPNYSIIISYFKIKKQKWGKESCVLYLNIYCWQVYGVKIWLQGLPSQQCSVSHPCTQPGIYLDIIQWEEWNLSIYKRGIIKQEQWQYSFEQNYHSCLWNGSLLLSQNGMQNTNILRLLRTKNYFHFVISIIIDSFISYHIFKLRKCVYTLW